jgi:hypothetical protein
LGYLSALFLLAGGTVFFPFGFPLFARVSVVLIGQVKRIHGQVFEGVDVAGDTTVTTHAVLSRDENLERVQLVSSENRERGDNRRRGILAPNVVLHDETWASFPLLRAIRRVEVNHNDNDVTTSNVHRLPIRPIAEILIALARHVSHLLFEGSGFGCALSIPTASSSRLTGFLIVIFPFRRE